MADENRNPGYQSTPPAPAGQWSPSPHIYPHSHHGTPAQEYSGFNFGQPQMPMEPGMYGGGGQHRPMHQQLQPLIMPQWPSMLSSQSHSTYQPMYPQPVQPMQPMGIGQLPTPVSAASSRSTSTPRKTLTDLDRKRMCQYAEEHPSSKQTEIGAIFGVERSTVSKVLRQKEKYLYQDDGSRSPIKRAKGRSPDIERALAVWAKNQERKGVKLSDDIIRDKARAFAATTPAAENHQALSSSWLEKFKLKNNLLGARSRKGSLAPDDGDLASAAASSSHTPSGTSPVSPHETGEVSPVELHSAKSRESLKNESPDSYLDFASRHGPFHSQSATSLNSAFTDTAPSSFSPGPLSPTSPFFTPDSGTAPSPFAAPLTARPILPATIGSNSQRPRSQTFPLLDQYMSGGTSNDALTPKYSTAHVLDSPMEEPSDPLITIDETIRTTQPEEQRPTTVTPSDTMRPPPLPAHILAAELKRQDASATPSAMSQAQTSPEEAQRALELLLGFYQQQPRELIEIQDIITISRLLERLKLHSRAGST